MRIKWSRAAVRHFSEPQRAYMEAAARYGRAKVEYEDLRQPLDDAFNAGKMGDEDWANKVTALEFGCGCIDAHNKLMEAERELVNWARGKLEAEITEKQKAEIAVVWENWYLPSVREKVIDLCMRLEN